MAKKEKNHVDPSVSSSTSPPEGGSLITPFASFHLRPCAEDLPYFVPQPPRDSLMPPLPDPVCDVFQRQTKPSAFTYYDETVFLLAGLVSLFINEENISPPKNSDLVFDVASYFTNQKRWAPEYRSERCYTPQVREIELMDLCLTDNERAPRVVAPFGYRNGKGELLTTAKPQPPPPPLQNAERYEIFQSIPNLHLKSAAKTPAGIARFREKATKLWGDNRFTHWLWNSVLAACCASCGSHEKEKVHDLLGCVTVCATCKTKWRSLRDERQACSRCGSSVFVRSRRAWRLKCFDCGLVEYDSTAWWNKPKVGSTDKESTQGVPNRSKWLASRIKFFNPTGKSLGELSSDEIAQITSSPEFKQQAQEYEIEFSNTKTKDAATALGESDAAVRKRKSRNKGGLKPVYHDVDFTKTVGQYFIVVTLNGRNHLKILGTKDASFGDVLKALFAEWQKSETNALKQARQTAKKDGLGKKAAKQLEYETAARIQDAYDTAIGLLVPDDDGRIGATYSHFYLHELVELAAQDASMAATLKALGGETVKDLESVT